MALVGDTGLRAPSVYQDWSSYSPSHSEDDTLLTSALIGLVTLTFDLETGAFYCTWGEQTWYQFWCFWDFSFSSNWDWLYFSLIIFTNALNGHLDRYVQNGKKCVQFQKEIFTNQSNGPTPVRLTTWPQDLDLWPWRSLRLSAIRIFVLHLLQC